MDRRSAKLMSAGRLQTWVGVNYWSSAGGPNMWSSYDAAVVGAELVALRELGMNVTRSFFSWPEFMPTPDSLDELLIERFEDFLDQHQRLGMSTIPTFLVGHMSGNNRDPVWRGGRDLFTDVWFVARQAWYVRELTARFCKHPAVAAWLLSNEMPLYGDWQSRGVGVLQPEAVRSWAQLLIDAVRAGGGTQPVSVGDGAWGVEVTGADNGFRVRDLAPLVDFLGPHVYRMENDAVRQHLGAAFVCELLGFSGLPVVMEEFGVTSDYVSEDNAAHYYRQTLHNTLLAGATGWLAWNNTDYDGLWGEDPYSHHPFEMHFGLIDSHGRPKQQALEIKSFAATLQDVDFAHLSRPDAEAILVVPSYLEAQFPFTEPSDSASVFQVSRQAYVAAREADIALGVARELDGIPRGEKLYLLPSAKQLTTHGWRDLLLCAEAGATVYASFFAGDHATQRASWWPDLDQMFGVRKLTRYGLVDAVPDDLVRMTFVRDFGPIPAGTELQFAVAGNADARSFLPVQAVSAEVIAVDAAGRPALLRNRRAKGWMILGTYPLEYFAAMTPEVNPEPTWQLYDALAEEAGVVRGVRVADPRVAVSEMQHEDGRRFVWLVNHSDRSLTVSPLCSDLGLVRRGSSLESQVTLEPYGVLVAEAVVSQCLAAGTFAPTPTGSDA